MNEESPKFDFFPEPTILSFKEHLNEREYICFEREEIELERSRMRLLEKYNEIVANRISRNELIEQVQDVLECRSEKWKILLSSFENKELQRLLSVIVLAKKDKSENRSTDTP